MSKLMKVVRWLTVLTMLSVSVISGYLMLQLMLASKGEELSASYFLLTILGAMSLLAFVSLVVYARAQKTTSWGSDDKNKLIPLTTDKTIFNPPLYEDGTPVPAELWLGLSTYNSLVFMQTKKLVEIARVTLFSWKRAEPNLLGLMRNYSYKRKMDSEFKADNSGYHKISSYHIPLMNLGQKIVTPGGLSSSEQFSQNFRNEVNKYVNTKKFNPLKLVTVWAIGATIASLFALIIGGFNIVWTVYVFACLLGLVGIYSLREEKVRYLNPEGTRIVLEGEGFKKFFTSADKHGNYSLEEQDFTGAFVPWAIAFKAEHVWEKAFAYRPDSESQDFIINDVTFTKHDDFFNRMGDLIKKDSIASKVEDLQKQVANIHKQIEKIDDYWRKTSNSYYSFYNEKTQERK